MTFSKSDWTLIVHQDPQVFLFRAASIQTALSTCWCIGIFPLLVQEFAIPFMYLMRLLLANFSNCWIPQKLSIAICCIKHSSYPCIIWSTEHTLNPSTLSLKEILHGTNSSIDIWVIHLKYMVVILVFALFPPIWRSSMELPHCNCNQTCLQPLYSQPFLPFL